MPVWEVTKSKRDLLCLVWYNSRMNPTLQEISEKARPVFEKYGVKRAQIFGSYARGEAGPNSDIDLLLDLDPEIRMGLIAYIGMQEELKERLGRDVDVITGGNINRHLRPYIEPDARMIYEG